MPSLNSISAVLPTTFRMTGKYGFTSLRSHPITMYHRPRVCHPLSPTMGKTRSGRYRRACTGVASYATCRTQRQTAGTSSRRLQSTYRPKPYGHSTSNKTSWTGRGSQHHCLQRETEYGSKPRTSLPNNLTTSSTTGALAHSGSLR